ncbi:hypothetical protein K469DRAFT_704538 [Zopfia rhizophila CBS 207.26]|uniref:DUF7707 domain-containing protein n=1 Tax=Zopfia rhizophila CBS 207.26 TaxID=1314779 RepID=A0A6A6E737_9PEZI|nr:hypothetical protein K469DRAFT_704538 [Zopfia rhizophila CBS 207.26]
MRSTFILSLLAAAGLSFAQEQYTIDPESVSKSDRQTWCDNQETQCPLICLQLPGVNTMNTISNDCDPDALTFNCVCSNNVTPNVTQYSQTLPYYICTEWGNQCVKACGTDNICSNECRADHPCGAQHPSPPNSSISSTMPATGTATGGNKPPVTGFGGAAATTAAGGKGAASAMLNLGQSYGLAVVFAGVFAGFAIIL